jgi:hypothetical protein
VSSLRVIAKLHVVTHRHEAILPHISCSAYASVDLATTKKDVAEHLEAFNHVGLLVNKPLGNAELLFI